ADDPGARLPTKAFGRPANMVYCRQNRSRRRPRRREDDMLSTEQIAAYHTKGYTLVEGAVAPALLAEINPIVDEFVAQARGATATSELSDLEPSHTPDAPRVRRLKEPVERHPLFWELVRSPGVIGPVTQLIGPDLRLHGSKLNMKAAGYGAAVEWHQDWAF